MSASDLDSSIYLSDTDNQIKKKIGQAFSGGQDTKELHEKLGGRTAVDMPFQFMTFFLEDDDELERIKQAYETGAMQSGEMKMAATKELQNYVRTFRESRSKVTPEIREEFMRPRQLQFQGMPDAKEQISVLEVRRTMLEKELALVRDELNRVKSD